MEQGQQVSDDDVKQEQEQLFRELVSEITSTTRGVTKAAFLEDAMEVFGRGGDQRETIKALRDNIDSIAHAPVVIVAICDVLKGRGVENYSSIISESTLDSASKIRFAYDCSVEDLVDPLHIAGSTANSLIHYALMSPDHEMIASLVAERRPEGPHALRGLVEESGKLTPPLRDGAL